MVIFSLEDDAVHGSNQLRAAVARVSCRSRQKWDDARRAALNCEKSKATTPLVPDSRRMPLVGKRHEASTNRRVCGVGRDGISEHKSQVARVFLA
jgi:hypothetical protein